MKPKDDDQRFSHISVIQIKTRIAVKFIVFKIFLFLIRGIL